MKPYYSADGITLYQGDNREVLAALGLKPEDVALLWGDPPYGIDLRPHATSRGSTTGKRWLSKRWSPIAGDAEPFDPTPWVIYPRLVLWGANNYASRLPDAASWWYWDKTGEGRVRDQNSDGELAWVRIGTKGVRCFSHLWKGLTTDSEVGLERVHPTQKPVALAAWGFRQAKLKPGDLVLSPWLGSGPEAVAARDMGLRFIGIELVTEYLDACVNRLRQAPLPLAPRALEPEQVGLGLSLDSPPAKR